MGNTNSDFQTLFHQKYVFIQQLQDTNYGLVKIYRKKQINFDYIMVYDEPLDQYTSEDARYKLQLLNHIRLNPHDQVLRLMNCILLQKNALQCKIPVLRCHIEYYNFTLLKFVQMNTYYRLCLTLDEVLYILNSIITAYQYFQKLAVQKSITIMNWLTFKPQHIFISTQGILYFSPIRIANNGLVQGNCGCDSVIVNKKQISPPERNKQKNLKNQMKKLILFLTSEYPKDQLQSYSELFDIIQKCKTNQEIITELPKSKIGCIDMQKQTLRLTEDQSDDSMSPNRSKIELNFSRTTQKLSNQKPKTKVQQKKSLRGYSRREKQKEIN